MVFLLLIDSNYKNNINFNKFIEDDEEINTFNKDNINYKKFLNNFSEENILNNEVLPFISNIVQSIDIRLILQILNMI